MNKLFYTFVIVFMFLSASTLYAADPESGKEVSKQCVACHGEDGNSPTPNFPRLAGQHEDYLFHALQSYKTGTRKNAIMAGIIVNLSEADMKNVAAYFATLSGLGIVDLEKESDL